MIIKYLTVAGLAAAPLGEVLVAVPAGVAMGLPVVPVMLLAFAANLTPVVIIAFIGNRWNPKFLLSPRGKKAAYYFEKYGLPGLGFFAPVLTGVYLAAFTALFMGSPRNKMLAWMTGGLVFWTAAITVLTVLGVDWLRPLLSG